MVPEDEGDDDLKAMGFASSDEVASAEPAVTTESAAPVEQEEEVVDVDPPQPQPPTPPPPPTAAPPAAPPAAPAEAPAPTTPEPDGVVVVDVEPSPGAIKFLGAVSEVGQNLSVLEAADVSDGMFELSKRCSKDMAEYFAVFKEHALDLAVTATTDAPGDEGRLRLVARQAELRKLAALPLAAMYAVFALCCMCAFAVIYYPKMYAPMLYHRAKAKMIEYGVDQKAIAAAALAKSKAKLAYESAANSELAAKSAETLSKAYSTVVTNPGVAVVASKTGEAADQLRSKIAERLVELKGSSASVPTTASGAV